MTAEMPTDRPVREDDPEAARKLIKARPKEYQAGTGPAVRVDPRWAALKAKLTLPSLAMLPPNFPFPTTFCHERYTPAGKRRLIVVEEWRFIAVIEPAGWLGGDLRLIDRSITMPDPATEAAFHSLPGSSRSAVISQTVCDPVDRSRFTVSFIRGGVTGTWEYRLGENDRVTARLLDPESFIQRAQAATAKAAATAPATRGNQMGAIKGGNDR